MGASKVEGVEGEERPPSWKAFMASGVGLELGIYVIGGFFLGRWLDGLLGTDPALMLTFVLFGVVIGIISMIRATRNAWPSSDDSSAVSSPLSSALSGATSAATSQARGASKPREPRDAHGGLS